MKQFFSGAVLAILVAGAAQADGLGSVIHHVGGWTVYRDTDPMTDAPNCTAGYGERAAVQLTDNSFAITYRGRGGLSSYRIRLDDNPPWTLRLPSRSEQSVDAFVIEGQDFERIVAAHRVRVQALTVLSSLVDDDVDMTGANEVLEVLRGPQCHGVSAPAGKPEK